MNTRNPRDIHGDGHGWVDVPQVSPKRAVSKWKYNYDLTQAPTDQTRILGLYKLIAPATEQGWVYHTRMIWLAAKPISGCRYVTDEKNEAAYYIQDPIAWSETPEP